MTTVTPSRRLRRVSANLGTVTSGYIQNAGNTAAIRLSGTTTLPADKYLDFTATGTDLFVKFGGLEVSADGSVNKFGGVLEANGIRYGPLHVDATDRATSGSGTTNLETFAIPANAMGATGGLHLQLLVLIDGTNNTKSVALSIGGSSIVNLIFGSSFEGRVSFDVYCFNTTTSTQRTHITALPDGGDPVVDIGSSSADTTSDVDFEVDGFVTNASDTVTLEVSSAELLAPGA